MAKPERVFKMGAVRASIFRNIIERQGQTLRLPKVVIEVRYRDKAGEWHGTNSLSINDVPKAVAALQQAYEYLLGDGTTPVDDSDDLEPGVSTVTGTPPTLPPRTTTWKPGKTL